MTDLSIIVLTYNERLHIRRCLERLLPLAPKQIFVVDCFSTDGTLDEVRKVAGGETAIAAVQHQWPGTQAVQFNWALDNLPLTGEWVMRIDADEYLDAADAMRMRETLATVPAATAGIELSLRLIWRGQPIRHGVSGIRMPQLFRRGRGRYDDRAVMDEKLLIDGEIADYGWRFYDHNLNDFAWWRQKHLGYAQREAERYFSGEHGNKRLYYRLPRYLRVIAYWALRYFFRLGLLDGRAGWTWNFWQGLWYRWQVDRLIGSKA